MRIALLEDDADQASLLQAWLVEDGHACSHFDAGVSFIKAYMRDDFDLVIMDWELPESSGIDVLKHLRLQLDQQVPVLFITQKNEEGDIVAALEAGADDYMTKPISQAETIARLRALARRTGAMQEQNNDVLSFAPYSINTRTRSILLDEVAIDLTQKEYELAVFLFRNHGRVVSRGHLLEMIWGTHSQLNTRTVDTHISHLRSKLQFEQRSNWRLTSVYRHGYRLEEI